MNIGVQWVVVDPLYLKMSKKGVGKSSVESWRIFLAKLGVQSHLAVRRIDQHITEVKLIEQTIVVYTYTAM